MSVQLLSIHLLPFFRSSFFSCFFSFLQSFAKCPASSHLKHFPSFINRVRLSMDIASISIAFGSFLLGKTNRRLEGLPPPRLELSAVLPVILCILFQEWSSFVAQSYHSPRVLGGFSRVKIRRWSGMGMLSLKRSVTAADVSPNPDSETSILNFATWSSTESPILILNSFIFSNASPGAS